MGVSLEDRIKLLREFCDEEPQNPFNYYSLFLEVQKVNTEESLEIGEMLIKKFSTYLPTYYMFGQLLEEDFPTKALEIYKKGIYVARDQKNLKTENELKSALQNLEFELD